MSTVLMRPTLNVLWAGLIWSMGTVAMAGAISTDSLNWAPSLDGVIAKHEELATKNTNQQSKDALLVNLNTLYDAKLYILFQEYLKKLSPDQQLINIKMQQKWLLERKLLSEQASTRYQGSLTSSAAKASLEATKKRIKAIQLQATQPVLKVAADTADKTVKIDKPKETVTADKAEK